MLATLDLEQDNMPHGKKTVRKTARNTDEDDEEWMSTGRPRNRSRATVEENRPDRQLHFTISGLSESAIVDIAAILGDQQNGAEARRTQDPAQDRGCCVLCQMTPPTVPSQLEPTEWHPRRLRDSIQTLMDIAAGIADLVKKFRGELSRVAISTD